MSAEDRRDLLVLSPHLDDAVLSCGGRLHDVVRAGGRALVVTLFAGNPAGEFSPLARELHQRWRLGAEDAVAARRLEDRRACEALGCDGRQWDFADALYRRDPDSGAILYPTLAAIFGAAHAADLAWLEALVTRLVELPPATTILAPLGAGGHVDHQLTRQAAERAFGGERLLYYEDFPYVRRGRLLEAALGPRRGWQSRTWPLGEEALAGKCGAIACYTSQLASLFGDAAHLERRVRRYARRVGGERFWQRMTPR